MYGGDPSVWLAWVSPAATGLAGDEASSVRLTAAGSGGWRSGIVRPAGSPVLVNVWPPGNSGGEGDGADDGAAADDGDDDGGRSTPTCGVSSSILAIPKSRSLGRSRPAR